MSVYAISFIFIIGQLVSAETEPSEKISEQKCPRVCTCVTAPMRAAAFVHTWMTSWGEDDLPSLHPNDVLNIQMMGTSETARDADVDVDKVGFQATCSLLPSTNFTELLKVLPESLMVLSILQAPGCNHTIIDGGELYNLRHLKALHLEGYAIDSMKQVSGFSPNKVRERMELQKLIEGEGKLHYKPVNLYLALAEDALQPLGQLQLLDLQYVRLVASKEMRRSRRFSTHPIDSKILLDMPIGEFLKLARRVDSFVPPPYLDYISLSVESDDDRNTLNNHIPHIDVLNELKKELIEEGVIQFDDVNRIRTDPGLHHIATEGIIPYDLYISERISELAPFKMLKNLKYLRVAHAKLDRIGRELLDGLHNLHTLTLEHNKVQVLPKGMFSPAPNLRHLSLAHNKLLSIDSDSFDGLSQLLTLDLDYNKLSIIGSASLPPLPALMTLRAVGNPITHLLPGAFSTLNNTKSVFIGSTDVSMDIHEDTFRFLSSLETLLLENITMNTLKRELLGGMGRLTYLTIHGHIPVIDYDAFSTIPLLIRLELNKCGLGRLSVDAFFGLKHLKVLDLSRNELTTLSPGTFDHLVKLRELYLHHNNLRTLPLGIFLPIPAKLIQLQNNPWHCTCDLLQLRPSITNKIKKPRRVTCQWDEKLETVCSKTRGKLVYDARVAPLCTGPPELQGNDVYHAALRHLKCSKHHWDPRLLLKNRTTSAARVFVNTKMMPKSQDENEIPKGSGFLPLISFTPEPVRVKDLLLIAEQEGLEEASHSPKSILTRNDDSFNRNIPQSDQPSPVLADMNKTKKILGPGYYVRKAAEKRRYEQKELIKSAQRREEKKRVLKKMEDKLRLKALIREKQKQIQQKKLYKLKMKGLF